MKTLWLLRHAKSAWNTDAPTDFERPLAPRGQRDAPRVGTWLADHSVEVALTLCSPAMRTRETFNGLCERWQGCADVRFESTLYHAGVADLLSLLHGTPTGVEQQMLIGHNPGLDGLLVRFCGDQAPRTSKGKLMTTASLAGIELKGWQAKRGRLRHLIRPRELP